MIEARSCANLVVAGSIAMEFNSTWFGGKRSRYVAHLLPVTIQLIRKYGTFYGIDPDQLIDSAVNDIMAKDNDFIDYVRGIHKCDDVQKV